MKKIVKKVLAIIMASGMLLSEAGSVQILAAEENVSAAEQEVSTEEALVYDMYENGSGKNITPEEAAFDVPEIEGNKADSDNEMDMDSEEFYYAASNMKMGDKGLALLKKWEGCRLTAYKAVSTEQYYTIGYGHYGADVTEGMTITQEEAENLLKSDLVRYENYVNYFLNDYNITVNQNQFDALVSFTYNLGNVWYSSTYPNFTLKVYLINGISNYTDDEIRAAFVVWNKSGGQTLQGLINRRNAEADLFLTPVETELTGLNIGTDFDAKIYVSGSSQLLFATSSGNVELDSLQKSQSCYWNFVRQSDGTYIILSKSTGKALDVEGADSANYTNVQVYDSNGSNAQKWYVLGSAGSYQLAPACAKDLRLDIYDGNIAEGANAQIYKANGTAAQNFNIVPADADTEISPLNLGSDFYATIQLTSAGKQLYVNTGSSNNVEIDSYKNTSGNYWHFVRQSDGSYVIYTMHTGFTTDSYALDVYGAGTANSTNVQVYSANNSTAQRWFITGSSGAYTLAPACSSDKRLDSYDAGTADGNNIQIYRNNGTDAQKFTITKATVSGMTGVKIGGKAADALRINWTKNTSANGYIIEQYKNGSWTRITKITSNATTTYRISGLTSETTYKFRIRAYKMVGSKALYSAYTNISGTTTKKTATVVSGLSIGGRASNALRLNWTKNSTAGGYIIEQYKSGSWTRIAKLTGNATTTYRVSGLKAGTTYKFRIKTYVMNGSAASYSTYKTISAKTLPTNVSNLVIGGTAKDALRLNWSKNTSAQGYIIEKQVGSKWTRVAKVTGNATTTYRVTGLSSKKTYNFRVRTYTMDGSTPLYGSYVYVSGTTK